MVGGSCHIEFIWQLSVHVKQPWPLLDRPWRTECLCLLLWNFVPCISYLMLYFKPFHLVLVQICQLAHWAQFRYDWFIAWQGVKVISIQEGNGLELAYLLRLGELAASHLCSELLPITVGACIWFWLVSRPLFHFLFFDWLGRICHFSHNLVHKINLDLVSLRGNIVSKFMLILNNW